MATFPTSVEFGRHTENLNAVAAALTQIERAHKRSIRDGDEPAEHALRKVHTLLLGVYAEARLRKILTDPTGFNNRERELIWLKASQGDRWLAAVDFAVRRHYQVLAHQSLEDVLPVDIVQRIGDVNGLLETDLEPIITDRNRLAHGQWVWQLKSRKENEFVSNPSSYDLNYTALRARFKLIDFIGRLVGVLCVSEPTFNRDFDLLMKKIGETKQDLGGDGYAELVSQLRRPRVPNRPSRSLSR